MKKEQCDFTIQGGSYDDDGRNLVDTFSKFIGKPISGDSFNPSDDKLPNGVFNVIDPEQIEKWLTKEIEYKNESDKSFRYEEIEVYVNVEMDGDYEEGYYFVEISYSTLVTFTLPLDTIKILDDDLESIFQSYIEDKLDSFNEDEISGEFEDIDIDENKIVLTFKVSGQSFYYDLTDENYQEKIEYSGMYGAILPFYDSLIDEEFINILIKKGRIEIFNFKNLDEFWIWKMLPDIISKLDLEDTPDNKMLIAHLKNQYFLTKRISLTNLVTTNIFNIAPNRHDEPSSYSSLEKELKKTTLISKLSNILYSTAGSYEGFTVGSTNSMQDYIHKVLIGLSLNEVVDLHSRLMKSNKISYTAHDFTYSESFKLKKKAYTLYTNSIKEYEKIVMNFAKFINFLLKPVLVDDTKKFLELFVRGCEEQDIPSDFARKFFYEFITLLRDGHMEQQNLLQ